MAYVSLARRGRVGWLCALLAFAGACAGRSTSTEEGSDSYETEAGTGTDAPPLPEPPVPDLPYEPACGDGILSDDEVCDDGNLVDDDGCNADCQADCVELRSMNTFSHEFEGTDVVNLALDRDRLAVLYRNADGDLGVSLRSLTGARQWARVAIQSPAGWWVSPAADVAFVDGDVMVTSGAGAEYEEVRGWASRLSPRGDLRFAVPFGSTPEAETFTAVAPTPRGGVVAFGGQETGTSQLLWGVQIDAAGQLLWEVPAWETAPEQAVLGVATEVAASHDGRVYALALDIAICTSSTDLVALEPGGAVSWLVGAGSSGWGHSTAALDVVATDDGGPCVLVWSSGDDPFGTISHWCVDGLGDDRWRNDFEWQPGYRVQPGGAQGRLRTSPDLELVSVVTTPGERPYDPDDQLVLPAILVQRIGLDGTTLCRQAFMFDDHDVLKVLDVHLDGRSVLAAGLARGAEQDNLFVATFDFAP